MNRRITLASVAARIEARLDQLLGVVKIGTALDSDFTATVGNPTHWPAVWVGGQRSQPGPATRRTSLMRQEVGIIFAVRVIVAKVVAGETTQEERMNAIADGVADVLIGWTPPGADMSIEWLDSQDGPAEQSAMTVDLVFKTRTTYQYNPAG